MVSESERYLRARVATLEAALMAERHRGDDLNRRNGRLEHDLSLLKPESQAKAFMEEAYSEMQGKVTSLKAARAALADWAYIAKDELPPNHRPQFLGALSVALVVAGLDEKANEISAEAAIAAATQEGATDGD